MSAQTDLKSSLRRLRRRARLLLMERYGLYGGAAGTAGAAILVLASYRWHSLVDYRLWLAAASAGLLAGAAWGLLRGLDDMSVARAADDRARLKERLSTAVSLLPSDEEAERFLPPVHLALLSDARSHAEALRPHEVFRRRMGAAHVVFGVALAALLLVVFLPQMPALQSAARRSEVAVMKKEGEKLARIAKEITKQTDPGQEDLRRLARRLQKLGWRMQTGRMTRKQAMLETQRLEKQVREEQDRLARRNSATRSMEQARVDVRRAAADIARRAADEIARTERIPLAEALKKLPSDQRLAELARRDGRLTETEQRELEEALRRYADQVSAAPIPRELAEALAKLAESGEARKAAELMREFARKLDSAGISSMDRKQLEEQLHALAKALKNTDLDNLAEQMLKDARKLARMSPEELEKLIRDMEQTQRVAQSLAQAGST